MTVSIIIAVKTWQNNLKECIVKCLELDYPDFEIIILPDSEIGIDIKGLSPQLANPKETKGVVPTRIIPTGPVNPAQKRDIAASHAKGEILAFIDDDAYPQINWLKNAVRNFIDHEVAAVGGPSVTPENDNFRQKASGLVYSTPLVSAKFVYRYSPGRKMEVCDYPSCNFLVRKSVMQELGGFKTNFWPGEDTKFCLDITKRLGKKIIYDPGALVYHHRRALFLPHLKQVASYALHRGYFAKRYPQTSLKIAYFIPSLFLVFLLAGSLLTWFGGPLMIAYIFSLSLYLLLVIIFSIKKDLRMFPMIFLGIILTHLTYGFNFIKGLFSGRLKEE
ncbi:MAG: glycosyltransferase [Candidatus Omnitrophota bacterium]